MEDGEMIILVEWDYMDMRYDRMFIGNDPGGSGAQWYWHLQRGAYRRIALH
jgi:hypothetical protein